MSSRVRRFEQAFEHGETSELMQLNSVEAQSLGVLHLAILAHCLFGDLQAAIGHFQWSQKSKKKFSAGEEATIHFALGVGHTRISEYARARSHFAHNFRFRDHADLRSQFFLWQGLGFFRYFTGAYSKSGIYARRAFELARQMKFHYGLLISEELLAHSCLENGQVRVGMKHMKNSLLRARSLKHRSLRQSFRLLLLLNQARFGLNWDPIPTLEKALRKLHPQDTYSRNAVKLEHANQWMIRGMTDEAFAVLDEACDSIYASQNRRQIAQLNFRLAFLTWLRGRRDEALHLLKSAELHLHKEVDVALWKRMRGLRERMLSGSISAEYLRERESRPFGEDRIADLYQKVLQKDQHAIVSILEHKLFFFLYSFYGLEFDQKALIFDLLPRGLIIVDQGNISVVDKGFSRINRRILESLAVSHQSKEELIVNIWGYTYEASRHDALVYTSISKIRQLLGKSGAWLEADEKGYRLRSGVRLECRGFESDSLKMEKPKPVSVRSLANPSLNFRQLRILAQFDRDSSEAVGVDEVMRDYAVSRATATRDLTELTKLGFLQRLGRARATKYLRTREN